MFKLDMNYKNLLIAVLIGIVLVMLYRIQTIISVFAVSFFIAYLMDPVIDRLERLKIPRAAGILMLIVALTIILGLLMLWLLPVIYSELEYLAKSTPKIVTSVLDMAQRMADTTGMDISLDNIQRTLAPKAGQITAQALNALENIIASATSAVGTLINAALIPILIFYFLKDFDRISANLFELSEKRYGSSIKQYMMDFDKILSKYFRGQIIIAGILGVMYTAALLIADVKPAILIGLVSGVLSIVPYLGFMIGFSTSLALAVVQHQDILHPFLVVAGFTVAQAAESNFFTPKIIGETLGLHPTVVIFALLAGGTLFGIGGMILALPIAAFIKVLGAKKLAE